MAWIVALLFFRFWLPIRKDKVFFLTLKKIISIFFVEVECQIKPIISNLKAFVEKNEIIKK